VPQAAVAKRDESGLDSQVQGRHAAPDRRGAAEFAGVVASWWCGPRLALGRSRGGFQISKVVGIAVILVLACAVTGATAEEIEGTIRALDRAQRAFTLEDGTRIWVAEGVSMATLKEGVSVKASYEERDGRKIGTGLNIEPSRPPVR
jgi:hypothetical protein